MFNVRTLVLGVAVLALSQSAEAQTGIRISRGGITFQAGLGNRYANPHHSHTLGHGSTHILPYGNHGTYYARNGHHYYLPQTASLTAPAPQELAFGGFSHVDELALQLETLLNELCLDLYYNYSHNPGFQETYAEAYTLLEAARYIHAAEHHGDRDAMRSRLGGADALFHHIEDDVRGWSRVHHRQIGALGILTKMEMTEDTLHHLMNDMGVSGAPELAPPPAGAPVGPELAPPPVTIP